MCEKEGLFLSQGISDTAPLLAILAIKGGGWLVAKRQIRGNAWTIVSSHLLSYLMGICQDKRFYLVSDQGVKSYFVTANIIILGDDNPAALSGIGEPYIVGRRWIKIIIKDMNFYSCTP